MKKLIILSTIVIILFTIVVGVNAQQVSLSISPPLLELIIKPGKSIMIAYQLKNSGDPTIVTAKLVNFEPKDNLGNIKLKSDLQGPIRFSLDNSDIQLERPFFLKTGASQQLLLRIRAIEGAETGDYYYTLLSETTPQTNNNGETNSQAKATIGSNILVTVSESGLVEIKPKTVLFDVLNKFNLFGKKINLFDSFSKIPLVFIISNKGKNLIKPQGSITLKGNFGEKIDYKIVPKNILSESERLIDATPSSQINFNNQPVSLVISGFFIGQYNLSSQVNFGDNSPTIFSNTKFFAFPFKLLFIVFVVITLTIYIIKRFSNKDESED